jgi:small nuclear ribonucleoprotein (snRNP)-like protein
MNITVGEIMTLKLNSGEELVTKIVAVDGDNITIVDPVSIAPSQGGVGLIPSLFTNKMHSNVQLNTTNVVLIGDTDESVKTKYIEATTGLKVPDKKMIMG